MSKSVLFLVFSYFASLHPQADNETLYKLNTNSSFIFWECADKFGSSHEGTLKFLAGNIVLLPDGSSNKGGFTIDMNSLQNTDINLEKTRKELEDHLKSDDFFSVRAYPQAAFTIKRLTPSKPDEVMVSGLLTIKGSINEIKFPAVLRKHKDGSLVAKAAVTIDRTKWDITFQSETFFSSLKDVAISDNIKINLNLVFNR